MKRFLQGFFSFSRKEQLGILVLIGLIIAVLVLRSLLPGWRNRAERDFSGYQEQIDRFEDGISGSRMDRPDESAGTSTQQAAETVSAQAVQININVADSIELQEIRGIGPVLAKRIVKYRFLLGGFMSCEQLKEVYGIDEERYRQIEKQVYADSSGIRYILLNQADRYTLSRHPYLNESQAEAIINFRKVKGSLERPEQLLEGNILDQEVYIKISPYLRIQ